jgi:hypothetical protein
MHLFSTLKPRLQTPAIWALCVAMGTLLASVGSTPVNAATDEPQSAKKKVKSAATSTASRPSTPNVQNRSAKARAKLSEPLDLNSLRMARLPVADSTQLLAAAQVFYGDYGCDGDRTLHVAESTQHAGYIDVSTSSGQWTMKPVQSASGALRLEDVRQVTLLVQISTKSMLLDTESGRRLLDNCVSAPQRLSRQDDGPTLGLAR